MPDTTTHTDSLRQYLDQIGRCPLLTRAQEVQLAKGVEAGDPEARRRLIEGNLRLVVTIARSYRPGSADLLDLIQEGTLGLMRAVDRFDWRRDTKFSTYAAWWIRHGIVQALAAANEPVRVPESVRSRLTSIQRAERELAGALGRTPTASEVAAKLGVDVDEVLDTKADAVVVTSLDLRIGAERELNVVDAVADPNAPDPLQALIDETAPIDLEQTLRALPERGRTVIELRFGLRDGVARTADSVADELGLARERVRQIELNTLRRLAADARTVACAA